MNINNHLQLFLIIISTRVLSFSRGILYMSAMLPAWCPNSCCNM